MTNNNKKSNGFIFLLICSLACNMLMIIYLGKQFYYSHSISPKHKITFAYNRQTVFDILPIFKTDIVFAGDSHTQFFELAEFFLDRNIKNRGIYGDISAGLLSRMNQVTEGQPRKIFLEIGYNDLCEKITPDSISKNIVLMVKYIRRQSPDSEIYINSVFPSSAKRGIEISQIPIINEKIKQICRSYKIAYIDIYVKLATNNGLLDRRFDCGDGIHLNGQGYKVWSEIIHPYLIR